MSIEPHDFLATATKLCNGGNAPEADLRSAASRAYYAALHASHQALPMDLVPTTDELRSKASHQAIIDAMQAWAKAARTGRNEAINITRRLRRLRDFRKSADYSLMVDFPISDSLFALKDAESVLKEVDYVSQKLTKEEKRET